MPEFSARVTSVSWFGFNKAMTPAQPRGAVRQGQSASWPGPGSPGSVVRSARKCVGGLAAVTVSVIDLRSQLRAFGRLPLCDDTHELDENITYYHRER